MLGSMQPGRCALLSLISAGDASEGPPPSRASIWRRDGLLHPSALPLGFALGCCLALITALIIFF